MLLEFFVQKEESMIAKNIQDGFVHVSALRVGGKGTTDIPLGFADLKIQIRFVQVILKDDFLKLRKAIETNC